MPHDRLRCDVLVVGSGIAGLSFALEASRWADVIVVSKRAAEESNTKYAQGGIAAVLSPDDSIDAHVQDTLVAGAGLCREDVVRAIVTDGPDRVRGLVALGVRFDPRGAAHEAGGRTSDDGGEVGID